MITPLQHAKVRHVAPCRLGQDLFVWLVLAAVVGGAYGCSTNPATGRRQLNLLSASREVAIGQQASPELIEQYGGQIPSEPIRRYVQDLGQRLAAVSERPDLPWSFHVLDSAVINAFALPGGQVFLSRGLLAKLDNEAQLAGVLGHEIGHVTAQHIGQQMTQVMILQGLGTGLAAAADQPDSQWLQVLGIGSHLYRLKYSRDQESEADTLALRYMTHLGYNPVGQLQVMQVLRRQSAGQTHPPQFLATHPLPETRIRRLDQTIREHYPDYDNPSVYRFNFQSFQQQVLDRLPSLPPPGHGGVTKG